MRPLTSILLSASVLASAMAQPSATHPQDPPAAADARAQAVERLTGAKQTAAELQDAVRLARESGVAEQTIVEARFLHHVDHNEDSKIADMAPEFLKLRDAFKASDTIAFATREDWLAVVEYSQALASLRQGDQKSFKQHITEAFWLSPGQGAAFAPHIERARLEEAMKSLTVDFSIRLRNASDPKNGSTLEEISKGKKCVLLHFWSPASDECEASLPDFIATAKTLARAEIAVVTLIPGNDAAKLARDPAGTDPSRAGECGRFMLDSLEKPLSGALRIRSLPTMVLLSNQGKVLFNGQPDDPALWENLTKIDSRATRPEAPGKTSADDRK